MSYRGCINPWALAVALTLISFGPAATSETVGSNHEPDTATATAGSVVLYTNHDLPPALPSTDREPIDAKRNEPGTVALPPLTYVTYIDRKGRDEKWWRDTLTNHLVATAEAEEKLQRAYRLLKSTAPRLYDARRARVTTDDLVLTRADYQDAQARVDALAKRWDDLMEDARTSAALPGWLR